MAGFGEKRAELEALDISVIAASVDSFENAKKIAENADVPIGYDVSRNMADTLGAWWDDRRQFIQPAEFILGPDNRVLTSSYSDGPIARMLVDDVLRLVAFVESRKK